MCVCACVSNLKLVLSKVGALLVSCLLWSTCGCDGRMLFDVRSTNNDQQRVTSFVFGVYGWIGSCFIANNGQPCVNNTHGRQKTTTENTKHG